MYLVYYMTFFVVLVITDLVPALFKFIVHVSYVDLLDITIFLHNVCISFLNVFQYFAISLSIAVILSLINIYSVKCTAYVTVVFSGLKLISIAFIVIVGVLTVMLRQSFPERLHQPFEPLEGHHPSIGSVAIALYGVMWAYDGW